MKKTLRSLRPAVTTVLCLLALGCGGDPLDTLTPLQLTAVSAGYYSSCGLDEGGAAWCWGDGVWGQLGFPPPDDCTDIPGEQPCAFSPGMVATPLRFDSISVGGVHACGLVQGKSWCWGDDKFGQLGNGTSSDTFCETVLSSCATVPVQALVEAKAISAGGSHTCALVEDGRAFCWGYGAYGRLGNDSNLDRQVPTPVEGALRFSTIVAGGAHTCAIDVDGGAWCWGFNHLGQLGDGSTASRGVPTAVLTSQRFIAMSLGAASSCAIATDGTPWCWGAAGSIGPAIANADCEDGAVPCATVPGQVSRRRFTGVATGEGYACGVGIDGSFCWGTLPWQGGDPSIPLAFGVAGMSAGAPFTAISLGFDHGCGVTAHEAAYCWGGDYHGKLGDGPGPPDVTGLPVRVVLPVQEP